MKHYKDSENNLYAYESDGSQDAHILPGLTPITVDELTALVAEKAKPLTADQIRTRKLRAYQEEADPLFFKWQRGEATEQEWLDKIAEIKAR
jgi:hypothetical protein